MVKYGIVGAIALAVLVAATWDGKKKPKDDVAKSDVISSPESAVTGEVGGTKTTDPGKPLAAPPAPPPVEPPKDPPRPQEEEFLKYTVQKGDNFKGIARKWLGDEKLAQALCDCNSRIPDAKHLRPGITLVFPKSKLGSKAPESPQVADKSQETGTAGSSLAAGMKKDEKPTEVAAGDKKYVVKAGDTLFGIAKRELGKGSRWSEIVKLNNLSGNSVKKGQTLVLPEK